MHGGRSNLPLDDILPPPAEDMIDDIEEESDHDGETWYPNPRSFRKSKTGFQNFDRKLQQTITRKLRYLEVIQTRAYGLLANNEQSLVADENVTWLRQHNFIVNPAAAASLADRNGTSSHPAEN